uniref:F-box domain-containing protein n=1 Tax=Cucumis melo TaxID=3656 RepID=A0A9I9EHS7_CUCME
MGVSPLSEDGKSSTGEWLAVQWSFVLNLRGLSCSYRFRMSNPLERYHKLSLIDSLGKSYSYPLACKELSFLIRGAFIKLPKNLQSLIYQHIITAFHLLPELEKIWVAFGYGSCQLPQDVLLHIFRFLDVQSLGSAGLVCRSWNVAADDEYLWQLQYTTFFGCPDDNSKPINDKDSEDDFASSSTPHVDWKEEFKKAYVDSETDSDEDVISEFWALPKYLGSRGMS